MKVNGTMIKLMSVGARGHVKIVLNAERETVTLKFCIQ